MGRGRIGRALAGGFVALLCASVVLSQTTAIDRPMLESLHEAGQAFRQVLADPNATIEAVENARLKLDHEVGRLSGRLPGAAEQRIVELYGAATSGYQQAEGRFVAERSREQ